MRAFTYIWEGRSGHLRCAAQIPGCRVIGNVNMRNRADPFLQQHGYWPDYTSAV